MCNLCQPNLSQTNLWRISGDWAPDLTAPRIGNLNIEQCMKYLMYILSIIFQWYLQILTIFKSLAGDRRILQLWQGVEVLSVITKFVPILHSNPPVSNNNKIFFYLVSYICGRGPEVPPKFGIESQIYSFLLEAFPFRPMIMSDIGCAKLTRKFNYFILFLK